MVLHRIAALIGLCCALVLAQPAQAQKAFQRDDLKNEAIRLDADLRKEAPGATAKPAQGWRADIQTALRGQNFKAATAAAAAVAVLEPRDPAAWLTVANTALAVAANTQDGSEKYRAQERASTAAYAAYERATTKPQEAQALAVLGRSFEARAMYRPALDAWRLSLAAADNPALRQQWAELREKRGFRITDYKVDSDAATPRICFTFSDPLARGRIDFAPFVVIQGAQDPAVTAENQQLCVDGLTHGSRYRIAIRQGLPSAVEEQLLKTADYDIYVRDRSPLVRFTGRSYVLPKTGQQGIPLVSVNTDKVEVDIYRIGDRSLAPTVRSDEFLKQLSEGSAREIGRQKGTRLWSGQVATRNELNRDIVTAFPIAEALPKLEPGIHVMTARLNRGDTAATGEEEEFGGADLATQWFVVSDLGLTSLNAPDGVHVIARSLASATAQEGIELRLIARNNEVLATVRTDRQGRARFDAGLARGEGGMAPALVAASDGKGDYGFLDIAAAGFDLTDRGVKGRAAPKGLDAFLATERGVYRPGETVQVTALLRDPNGRAAPNLPLTLVFKRPDGVEHRRVVMQDEGAGGRSLAFPLFAAAPRGGWRIEAFADARGAPIGEAKFLVEDYVPDRLDVTLTTRAEAAEPGRAVPVDILARYLYGAPGGALPVSGEVTLQPATRMPVKGFEDYAIGLTDEKTQPVTREIEDAPATDAEGRASVMVALPESEAQRPLEALIKLRVGEEGGRAVERSLTLPVRLAAPAIAVKKLFEDSALSAGAQAQFAVAVVEPSGRMLARQGVSWQLSRIERNWQWYQTDGRWSYESTRVARRVANGTLDISTAEPAKLAIPADWGSYRLDVTAGGMQTSLAYAVGYSGEMTADTPDVLEVTLDKSGYAAGEAMTVLVKPRFAGKATIAVIGTRVESWREIDVTPEGTRLTLNAEAGWGPGAYLVALAHRPMDQAAKRMPGRALGLAWFAVDRAQRDLAVTLDLPERIRPGGTLEVPVTLAGLPAGEEAFVTVSAVDIGILNLTRHEPPKPADFLFGQRQLSAAIRDLYGHLIDGMQGTLGAIRSGGDAGLQAGVSPPREAPLARYSGVVKVGPDGKARVVFDIPPFDGAIRVDAIAWTATRAGAASREVIIRDRLVAQATLPRFLSVGDRSRFHVRIDNVEGPAGPYELTVTPSGPIVMPADALSRQIALAARGTSTLSIPVVAAGPGEASVTVKLTGPDGAGVERVLPVRVSPGADAALRRVVRRIAPGDSLTLGADLVQDILPGSGRVSLTAGVPGGIDAPALLAALDRYPYGCTEQVVSRALPLLYVNTVAARTRLGLDDALDQKIRDAIDRVLARQDSAGSFGVWNVGGDDLWLDAYALDFLTRAREKNFPVPQRALQSGLDRLRNRIVNQPEFTAEGSEKTAYALYVLARNGRPLMSDLRYLIDTQVDKIRSPLARGQIAAALALLGDRTRSERGFAEALRALGTLRDEVSARADYGSKLRDAAGLLALAGETNQPAAALVQAASLTSAARAEARVTSTQENAWLVLAAHAAAREESAIRLSLNGTVQQGALQRSFASELIEAAPFTLRNEGTAPVELVVSVSGAPIEPTPASERGYRVERAYYRLNGQKVDAQQVAQNDRLVVVLTVSELEKRRGSLMLVDHLPAGLEIDNPNLVDGGKVETLPWLKRELEPTTTEFRDDRFVAVFDRWDDKQATYSVAYVVRAVSPGRYIHPPAVIEDMYRPDRHGRTAYGRIEVTGR